jgi:hypothetical protein
MCEWSSRTSLTVLTHLIYSPSDVALFSIEITGVSMAQTATTHFESIQVNPQDLISSVDDRRRKLLAHRWCLYSILQHLQVLLWIGV